MRVTPKVAAARLAYCERRLADPDLWPASRPDLEAKAEMYREMLRTRCEICGRPLSAEDSLAAGIGPVCWHREVVAA